MKSTKLLWFDLRCGLLQKAYFFLIPILVTLTSCLALSAGAAELDQLEAFHGKVTPGFVDFILYLYGGMESYIPAPGSLFTFPMRWMAVFLPAVLLTLQYPFRDMQGFGQQILIRTKGRMAWWLSKCTWNLCNILVYHGCIFGTAALFCSTVGADVPGVFHKELLYAVFQVRKDNLMPQETVWPGAMLLLPVLVSFCLSLLQMSLTLLIRPVFSFFTMAFIMISSAYFTSPYFAGNYAMPLRYNMVCKGGVSMEIGVMLSVGGMVFAVGAGCMVFQRYDILNRDTLS